MSQVLDRMELYNDDTRHGFEHTLGWLRQWACSRSFGLGTWRVPPLVYFANFPRHWLRTNQATRAPPP